MSLLRLTGRVGRVDINEFTIKQGERAGQSGEMRSIRVETGDCEFTDVDFGDKVKIPFPSKGQVVDYLVNVTLQPPKNGYGASVKIRVVGDYVSPVTGEVAPDAGAAYASLLKPLPGDAPRAAAKAS